MVQVLERREKTVRQFLLGLLVFASPAFADDATNGPPAQVTQFAARPENANVEITPMTGARISLQGREHGGYLNWLVARVPDTDEVRLVLLD